MKKTTASTLYITYDGLLDKLGGSQILPYLRSIANHPRSLHIISFEKPWRYSADIVRLKEELAASRISWTPLTFTARAGKVGKVWDLLQMYLTAISLHLRSQFSIIHCRSYQAMQVGCLLKRLYDVKVIFDMRGLWVDERMEGGIWTSKKATDRLIYRIYKIIEKRLLACADHVIVLTERVVPELNKLAENISNKLTIIPCCADYNHFQILDREERLSIRARLGLPHEARVLAYLGSLGTWYMLDEILKLFEKAQLRWGNVHLLMITDDWSAQHENLVEELGLSKLRDRIHIKSASRSQVAKVLGCADIMISFIKPTYSKIASSPTKLAEAFAVGLPVISNIGVGDVDQITIQLNAGALVELKDYKSVECIVSSLDGISEKGGVALRTQSRKRFGLEVAEEQYRNVYMKLE